MTRPPEPNPSVIRGGSASLLDRPISTIGYLAVVCGGSHDSFTGMLLALMVKADPGNRARLARAFPYEDRMLRAWYSCEDAPTGRQLHDAYVTLAASEQLGEQPC